MIIGTKTLAAINSKLEAEQDREHRKHLGASVIGMPCTRKAWYTFRWFLKESFEGRMLRLFARGHKEEPMLADWLRSVGIEVWTQDEEGKQFRVSAHGGHFGGSLDGVNRGCPDVPNGEPALCEFKTHNDKSFTKLVSDGLMTAKFQHFCQMQIYMHLQDLNWGLYMAVNKNDDAIHFEVVKADAAQAERLLNRAEEIIFSAVPPKRINNSPGYYECKFCHFQKLCHFGNVPFERNCRTCKFSVPTKEGHGVWQCSKGNSEIIRSAPDLGCGAYEGLNPCS